MAGKKQQAPKPAEDDSEETEEGWDNAVDVDADSQDHAGSRMRDWRDVEKYREMRELRRMVGDDFDFTDVLGEIPIRTATNPRPPARPAPPPKGAAKAAAPTPAPKGAKPAPPPAKPAVKAPPPPPPKAAKKPEPKPAPKAAPKPAPKKPAKPPVRAKAKKK